MNDVKYYNLSPNASGLISLDDLRRSRSATSGGLTQVGQVQFIDAVTKVMDESKLEYDVHEIYYKNNPGRNPGVEVLDIEKESEERQKEYAPIEVDGIQLHHPSLLLFKRLIGVFKIKGYGDNGSFGNIAFSISQNGFELASGLTVEVCSNMCIMSADQRVASFGQNKVNIDEMITQLENWTDNYASNYKNNMAAMEKLKAATLNTNDVNRIFGDLHRMNAISSTKEFKQARADNFASLGQNVITKGQSAYLRATLLNQRESTTAWDLVNDITLGMKPSTVDTVTLYRDNSELFEYMLNAVN